MEKSVKSSILVVSLCLCLVYTTAQPFQGQPFQGQPFQAQRKQPMPLCLMDCLAEWFPCEYECRVDWGYNRRKLRICTNECEQERASCMSGSSDPACNNNIANNQLHKKFKTL